MSVAIRSASARDLGPVESLLTSLKLPTSGVADWIDRFWLAESEGKVVGIAGLEVYGDGALLRSVAVDPGWRNQRIARRLTERALDAARQAGNNSVFLLTTTADRYFPGLGFERIGRELVPPGVQQSVEFRGACPDSAVIMRRILG
jgi:amino-acid N-acetyltransferase